MIDWPAYDNDPPTQVSPHHLRVTGRIGRNPLGRAMDVLRLQDGRLVIHNAICLDEAGMAAVLAFGTPAFLVVPSAFHRTDAPRWKARFPELTVLAPPGARRFAQKVVPVDAGLDALPADPHLRFELLDGTAQSEAVFVVDGETLIFCDAIFNLPHQPGCAGLVPRLMGSSGGPRVTPLAKAALVKDRAAFAAHLRRLAELPGIERAVVQHRDDLRGDVGATLRAIAARLA